MSLFEKAYLTYDNQISKVGAMTGEREPLVPISHTLVNAQVEITLDIDGHFISASAVSKDKARTIIPTTLESSVRSGLAAKDRPHPLSDQLMFLAENNGGNHEEYIRLLHEWEQSKYTHQKLTAVLNYIQAGTIIVDLCKSKVLQVTKCGELADGKIEGISYNKCLVRWRVLNTGEHDEAWWDKSLFECYEKWYISKLSAQKDKKLCCVSWLPDIPTDLHPKGTLCYENGAKLISSNDTSEFTFRGRFTDSDEVTTIGYAASQKAHNALRWLIATQGVSIGKRMFVMWQLADNKNIDPFIATRELFGYIQTEPEILVNRKKELSQTLKGYKLSIHPDDKIIIAVLDPATKGRLSIVYYNEIGSKDFTDRIEQWYASMIYRYSNNGKTYTPTLKDIVCCAFGTEREFLDVDDKIKAENMQRLLHCVVDKAQLPTDIVMALVNRFSRPLAYKKAENAKCVQNTAFAAVKKYRNEKYKEEWTLNINPNCKERSYLFGRLLAIAEMIEAATYDSSVERPTNALRLRSAFVQRPLSTWTVLEEKLTPYKKKLLATKPGLLVKLERIITEIMESLDVDTPALNASLSELYVLGYYHQRNELYSKKEDIKESKGE